MRRLFLATLLMGAMSAPSSAQFEAVKKADDMIGTKWVLLGTRRQKINELTFLKDGRVRCESTYKKATWMRVDKDHILFGYGPGSTYVVYRVTNADGTEMSGYTHDGRVRFIKKIR